MNRIRLFVAAALGALLVVSCSNPAEIYQKAEAHRKLGQHDLAVMEYKRVIKKQPDNSMAYLGLGLALLDQGKRDEARSNFESVIKLGGATETVKEANLNLGNIALEDGKPAQAIEYYGKVPDVDPAKVLAAKIALVKKQLADGNEDEAIDGILKLMSDPRHPPEVDALMQDPATASARSKIRSRLVEAAELKIREGKVDEAQSLLEQAKLYPALEDEDSRRVDAAWAVVYSEKGKCDEAEDLWDNLAKGSSDIKHEAEFYGIVCEMRSGKQLDALKKFEAFKENDPYYDRARAAIPKALKLIPTERFKVSLEKAHVRSGPSLKDGIIDKWPLAKEVRVIELDKKGWYRINYDGKKCAYMHESIITDRPVSIVLKKHGWERTQGAGWMLAFRPVVLFKLINLSTEPIKTVRIRMVVKQGRKVLSDDKFKAADISEQKPLKPDNSIMAETPANVRVELLTVPDSTTVVMYVSLNGGDFEEYKKFELNREVVEVPEEEGG